jgi:hypothetical protein
MSLAVTSVIRPLEECHGVETAVKELFGRPFFLARPKLWDLFWMHPNGKCHLPIEYYHRIL